MRGPCRDGLDPGASKGGQAVQLKDLLFQQTFARIFVYNILFEDAEVDERFFGVDEGSRVFCVSGAGCGVAGMLARNPARIDAVDINGHHLALTALKVEAARLCRPYSSFYDLLGRGWLPDAGPVLARITRDLPDWVRRYWRANARLFQRTLYGEGLTSKLVGELRRRSGIDGDWLRGLLDQPVEARQAAIEEMIGPVLRSPLARLLTRSPLQHLALGINYRQSERIEEAEKMRLADFSLQYIKRLAETDLRTNWFAWYFVTGQFHHDEPEGVPPYLRRDHYERSQKADTQTRYFRGSFFDALRSAANGSWTHYSLLDSPDWLDRKGEQRLLEEIARTGREGAIVLHRTVEEGSMFERNPAGRRFEEMVDETEQASALDRTRQYRRVYFHRLVH